MQFDSNPTIIETNGQVQDGGISLEKHDVINADVVRSDTALAVQQTNTTLATTRDRVKQEIIASGEAKALSDKLSVNNAQSIIEFGKPVAEKMSTCADQILRRQDMNSISQSLALMGTLNKIMDKVDIGEIKDLDKDPSFFDKIFNRAQQKLDMMVAKYNNVGTEIEKVCVELRTYEAAIEQSNKDLEALYNNGVESYKALVKYTIAGEYALDEVAAYISDLESRAVNDPDATLELNNVRQAQQLLEQRVQDLRSAETVALQSLPIIKSMEFGNLNLARKINSSFIVTIPVFKNAVAQAMIAKRQAYQAQALKALDEKTNEMLLKNAQNAADNMRTSAILAGSSAIKVETIEQSWQTIMDGIKDTRAIQEEMKKQRELDKAKLEEVNQKFMEQIQAN